MTQNGTHCTEAMPAEATVGHRGEWLRGLAIFADLSDAGLNRIAALLQPRSRQRGDYLLHAGTGVDELLLIRSGKVKLSVSDSEGREVIRDIVRQGQMLGTEALIGPHRSSAHAIAMTGVCLFALPAADVRALMDTDTRLALSVHRQVAADARRICQRMESLVLNDARSRLLRLIADLADTDGRVLADGAVLIEHGLTHFDIAGLTAISRQTATTLLNDLRAEGLINFDRSSILVHESSSLPK